MGIASIEPVARLLGNTHNATLLPPWVTSCSYAMGRPKKLSWCCLHCANRLLKSVYLYSFVHFFLHPGILLEVVYFWFHLWDFLCLGRAPLVGGSNDKLIIPLGRYIGARDHASVVLLLC